MKNYNICSGDPCDWWVFTGESSHSVFQDERKWYNFDTEVKQLMPPVTEFKCALSDQIREVRYKTIMNKLL